MSNFALPPASSSCPHSSVLHHTLHPLCQDRTFLNKTASVVLHVFAALVLLKLKAPRTLAIGIPVVICSASFLYSKFFGKASDSAKRNPDPPPEANGQGSRPSSSETSTTVSQNTNIDTSIVSGTVTETLAPASIPVQNNPSDQLGNIHQNLNHDSNSSLVNEENPIVQGKTYERQTQSNYCDLAKGSLFTTSFLGYLEGRGLSVDNQPEFHAFWSNVVKQQIKLVIEDIVKNYPDEETTKIESFFEELYQIFQNFKLPKNPKQIFFKIGEEKPIPLVVDLETFTPKNLESLLFVKMGREALTPFFMFDGKNIKKAPSTTLAALNISTETTVLLWLRTNEKFYNYQKTDIGL